MNNWLYAVMTIFTQRFSICNPKFGGNDGVVRPHLATRMETVIDGYVVLVLLLQS